MASSFASTSSHVDSAPVPSQTPEDSSPQAAPKKKTPRSAALTDAKNILRAATAATSKSLAAPHFVHRTPEIARHRRKCAICHHPAREAIEDLFVHWHSPEAIASHYEEDDESITWISIYRHAYAFGLDEIRRRNLRFVFEHILDQAGTTAATPASIIVAARALGSCVNENGQWNDPPKRVLVTNIIRNEPPQTAPPAQIENHADSENNVACVGADSPYRPAPSLTSPSSFEIRNSLRNESPQTAPPAQIENHANSENNVACVGADSLYRPAPSLTSPSSFEIRNSLNSFKSKEPPIANR